MDNMLDDMDNTDNMLDNIDNMLDNMYNMLGKMDIMLDNMIDKPFQDLGFQAAMMTWSARWVWIV